MTALFIISTLLSLVSGIDADLTRKQSENINKAISEGRKAISSGYEANSSYMQNVLDKLAAAISALPTTQSTKRVKDRLQQLYDRKKQAKANYDDSQTAAQYALDAAAADMNASTGLVSSLNPKSVDEDRNSWVKKNPGKTGYDYQVNKETEEFKNVSEKAKSQFDQIQ